jgi:hypothetical protein
MLAYILALAVGLGSFSIYMAAFFFPEVHRKSDFTWSGVGLFYALILWACAGRITGALLLGQMAGVAMLGSFAWETLTLRRLVTPIAQQTPIPQSANLAAGVPFAGLFGKKKEPAAKKPKFVRSPKPKADVVSAPVTEGEVKVEEQSAISSIPQTIAESSLAPDSKIPESNAPAIAEIPVFSVETPAAETKPAPAELASSFTPLPLPIEFSEIVAPATVEPAEAQPEAPQQTDDDDFDEMWRARATQSATPTAAPTAEPTAAPEASSTPAKVAKKSAGFGSLFGNIKNSLGGMLGLGAAKNKSDATPQTATPKVTRESIAPESKITAIPAPDIDSILQSELAEAAAEVTTETSNTAVETSRIVPFPTDVEAMAELIAAETASSAKIEGRTIDDRSSADTQTPPSPIGQPEAQAPAVSLEMTVVEIVSVASVDIEASGQPELSVVEAVSVTVMSIESTDQKLSETGEQPELIRPNPPTSELEEPAQSTDESKSDNLSDENRPSS